MKALVLLCFTALWIVAGTSAALADGHGVRMTIESLNDQWNSAFNRGDDTALASLYAEDATIAPRNGMVISGREKIRQFFKKGMEKGIHNHRIEIVTAAGEDDVLHEIAQWTANGPEKDGAKPTFGGVVGMVFNRNDKGDWAIQTHIWNLRAN